MTISIDSGSVCIIECSDLKRFLGTGYVFIKNDILVTAKHVAVDEMTEKPRMNLVAFFQGGIKLPLTLLATHKKNDIAILRINGKCPCSRPLMPSHESLTGTNGMFYAGYSPSNSLDGTPTISVSSIHKYDVHRVERLNEKDEIILEFPAEYIEPGFSGGPILAEGGSVVGIITQMFSERGKSHIYGRATSIENLMSGLEFSISNKTFNLNEQVRLV